MKNKVFGARPFIKAAAKFSGTVLCLFCIFVLSGAIRGIWLSKRLGGEPDIWGFKPVLILSGSMEPELKTGSVVLVRKTEHVTRGDIIMFSRPDGEEGYVIHRYIDDTDDGRIITRGDRNPVPDSETVDPEDVFGKVISIAH